MNAPAALYWYHQQPRQADYRNSSANRTGPYITELDITGQPGVFKLVKYVPEAEVAAAVAAAREACAKVCDDIGKFGDASAAACAAAIRARGEKGGAKC